MDTILPGGIKLKKTLKENNVFQKIGRMLKLNFVKLLRSPEGANKVALGFAIGFGLEMLVISTAGLIYVLLIPLVRLSKASLPVAIIGNLIGKVSLLPVILLPLALKIGKLIYPGRVRVVNHLRHFSFTDLLHGDFQELINLLYGGIHVLIGMIILGSLLGFISYFVINFLYEKEKNRRLKKRQAKFAC
jgi:uncharacterized protein (DUF2062 family)